MVGAVTTNAEVHMNIESDAFSDGSLIPVRYTGDGDDISPGLSFTGIPAGARELALIVDDPDAPRAEPWVHWVIYKMPASVAGLPEGVAPSGGAAPPVGTVQGPNDFGEEEYGGPAPPVGHGVHHYHFRLYALDADLDLPVGLGKSQLLEAIEGHVLATAEFVGTYER